MVFYSISDVTDKLLSTSGDPIPTLQEDFWISSALTEPTAPLREVLEDLSPPAMAAFDLACSQCQLWKTCKQLLETAERRLNSSLESRGRRLDHVLLNADGIRGFPVVLQQISKILNYSLMSTGQTKSGELLFSLFFFSWTRNTRSASDFTFSFSFTFHRECRRKRRRFSTVQCC